MLEHWVQGVMMQMTVLFALVVIVVNEIFNVVARTNVLNFLWKRESEFISG